MFCVAKRFRCARFACYHVPYQPSVLRTGGIAVAVMPGQVTVFKLVPGTHLRLHAGPKNQRLTLHLGLTVPSGTTIRVGAEPGEIREWEEGKVLAFDDSFVHEVRAPPLPPTHLKNMQGWALLSPAYVFQVLSLCERITQHGLSATGVAQRDRAALRAICLCVASGHVAERSCPHRSHWRGAHGA